MNKNYILPLFLAVAALICLASGIMLLNTQKSFEGQNTTQAEIVEIVEEYEWSASEERYDTTYTVFINYYVNGVEYETLLNAYSHGMSVGDTVEIYYMSNDPYQIYYTGSTWLPYLAIIIGIIFTVACIVVLVSSYKKLQAQSTDMFS